MEALLLSAQHLVRRFGRFEAVRGVSFEAGEGEVLGLLGQNGAGKTTVMNMLAGFLAPTSGQVLVAGKDAALAPLEARRRVGYLPEIPPVYPELTVKESLDFVSELRGVVPADRKRHAADLMDLAGLTDVRDQTARSLSKGYRQRLGFAQALCGNPDILLLDEPTGGFDPVQAAAFHRLIGKLARGKLIILSSHLLTQVQAVCTRALILRDGRLVSDVKLDARQAAVRFLVAVDAPAARVLSPIRNLPTVRRAKVVSGGDANVTRLEVDASAGFERALFTLLSALQAPLLELTPLRDTLEEAFFRAYAGEGEAN
ncbi:MAG TPA: ABC transporter ATP-binding protein [Candidatus Limnocylindria bacterium]|nr:ABC transporter ATP-binding protein [Candidatus Limnocylindria bacterium]